MQNPYDDPVFRVIMRHRFPIIHDDNVSTRDALRDFYNNFCGDVQHALSDDNSLRFVDTDCYIKLSSLLPQIKEICNQIISIFDYNDKGEIEKFAHTVDEIMDVCRPYLFIRSISKLYPNSDEESLPGGGSTVGYGSQDDILHWYRMRSGRHEQRKDLFHVPWSLRRKIPTGRYSVAGQPCLYLSSTASLPWYEMNMPHEATEVEFIYLNGYRMVLQKDNEKDAIVVQALQMCEENDKETCQNIENLQAKIREREELIAQLNACCCPCHVLDFTVPTAFNGVPYASQDFVMKMIGQYNSARSKAPKPHPFKDEKERIQLLASGVKVDYPECTVSDANSRVIAYIFTIPLIAACSVAVNDPAASFKEEYVFPQQVLLWVMRQLDIDGIAYRPCSKITDSRALNAYDIVLPANDLPSPDKDYSVKLNKMFLMSEPRVVRMADYVRGLKDKRTDANNFINELEQAMRLGYFEPYDDMKTVAQNLLHIYDALAPDSYENGEAISANLNALSRYTQIIIDGKVSYTMCAEQRAKEEAYQHENGAVEAYKAVFDSFENNVVRFLNNLKCYESSAIYRWALCW